MHKWITLCRPGERQRIETEQGISIINRIIEASQESHRNLVEIMVDNVDNIEITPKYRRKIAGTENMRKHKKLLDEVGAFHYN